jgi:hypothetical protein
LDVVPLAVAFQVCSFIPVPLRVVKNFSMVKISTTKFYFKMHFFQVLFQTVSNLTIQRSSVGHLAKGGKSLLCTGILILRKVGKNPRTNEFMMHPFLKGSIEYPA